MGEGRPGSVARLTSAVKHAALALLTRALQRFDFKEVQRHGWHFQRRDYYSAVNDVAFLEANRDLWSDGGDPLAIDWNAARQREVARECYAFAEELRGVPQAPQDPVAFCWDNAFWNNADALVQYGLVRARKPARYFEIGCGWSSLLLARALERNRAGGAPPTRVELIEPHPNPLIFERLPAAWSRRPVPLQRVPLALFDELEAGDVLFYDGSHVVRTASDVNWFFFRVLPRLQPGVLVHLHDIFLPADYPEEWIFERGQTWNEQYLLQAFLMENRSWRIEIANRWLFLRHRAEVEALAKGVQPSVGCSFWMVKEDPAP